MTAFKDHFSGHAAAYRLHRPGYADTLFRRLAAAGTFSGPGLGLGRQVEVDGPLAMRVGVTAKAR